jgi:iron(III) transport system substrate-binding protein
MAAKLIGLGIALLVFSLTSLGFAQDAKLMEGAKKEGGKVVVYGSLESGTVDAIKKAFEVRTGLTLEYWRASATKVMDRALSEYRAGRPLYDVVLTNAAPMEIMKKEGIFAKYESPLHAEFPKEIVDKDGILGPAYRSNVVSILINTKMVKLEEAPKTLEDLLNPKWKGKLAMPDPTQHTTTTSWLANLEHVLGGKESAGKFIRALGATKPFLVESFIPSAQAVVRGERPLAISYVKYVLIYGRDGAPIDYVRLPKLLGEGHHVALAAKAPHPNAGKVFIDYFLDGESMRTMAEMGEFVTRKGVYPPIRDAAKLKWIDMSEMTKEEFAVKKEEYKKIFSP